MAKLSVPLTGAQHDIAAGDYPATITELGAGLRASTGATRSSPNTARTSSARRIRPAAGAVAEPGRPRPVLLRRRFLPARPVRARPRQRHPRAHPLDRLGAGRSRVRPRGAGAAAARAAGLPVLPGTAGPVPAQPGQRPRGHGHRAQRRRPAAPYGTGSHPYLRAGDGLVDDCSLELPATHWLAADDRGIPSGPPREVAGTGYDFQGGRAIETTTLDHAFTGLSRDNAGRAWARLTGRTPPSRSGLVPVTPGCRPSLATRSARTAAAARWRSSR